MPQRRTPLYDVHVRAGAQMVKGGGDFWFPLCFDDDNPSDFLRDDEETRPFW